MPGAGDMFDDLFQQWGHGISFSCANLHTLSFIGGTN
jgi:hypothetical protein